MENEEIIHLDDTNKQKLKRSYVSSLFLAICDISVSNWLWSCVIMTLTPIAVAFTIQLIVFKFDFNQLFMEGQLLISCFAILTPIIINGKTYLVAKDVYVRISFFVCSIIFISVLISYGTVSFCVFFSRMNSNFMNPINPIYLFILSFISCINSILCGAYCIKEENGLNA